jgi:hypothetical protein
MQLRRPEPTISVDEMRIWRIGGDIELELALIQETETGEPLTPRMISRDADARAIYDGSWFKRADMGKYTWEGKQ